MSNKRLYSITALKRKIPEFIRSNYPQFVDFIEVYYKFLAEYDYFNLVDIHDIDKSHEHFLDQFKLEYSRYFPIHLIDGDKSFVLKHLREFYISRGSEQSFKSLFSVLFNSKVYIEYPSDNVLIPSKSKWKEFKFIEVDIETEVSNINLISSIQIENENVKSDKLEVFYNKELSRSIIWGGEQLSNSNWKRSGSAIIQENITNNPFGQTTADRLYLGGTVKNNPLIYQDIFTGEQQEYYVSGFVKKHQVNHWFIRFQDVVYINNSCQVSMYTYLTGTGLIATRKLGSGIDAPNINTKFKMENFGNGWYRVSFPIVLPKNKKIRMSVGIMRTFTYSSGSTNVNDGTYFWGISLDPETSTYSYNKGRIRSYFNSDDISSYNKGDIVTYYDSNGNAIGSGKIDYSPSKVTIVKSGKDWISGQVIRIPGTQEDTLVKITSIDPSNGSIKSLDFIEIGNKNLGEFITYPSGHTNDPDYETRLIIDSPSVVSSIKGTWETNESHLSNNLIRLHDNYYYQKMSYDLKSEINPNRYINIIESVNHPIGRQPFYTYQIPENFDYLPNVFVDEKSYFKPSSSKNFEETLSFNLSSLSFTTDFNRYERSDYFASREDQLLNNDYAVPSTKIDFTIVEENNV